jgi:hypothetical protein
MNKIKTPSVLIMIPAWKRSEIFSIVLKQLDYFTELLSGRVKADCLFILSPEDTEINELRKSVSNLKMEYTVVYYPNYPVGEKHNAGINYAIKHLKFDYLMNFGSDDLIHPAIMELYLPYIFKKCPLFGINNIYFKDLLEGKQHLFKSAKNDKAIGAGRMIHSSILKKLKKKQINLYENEKNRGLDGCSSDRVYQHLGIGEKIIDAGEFPFIVDLKSEENITPSKSIERYKALVEYKPNGFLEHAFPVLSKVFTPTC